MKKTIITIFSLLSLSTALPVNADQNPDKLYRNECGACHTPYPPVFLAQKSWDTLLSQLADHFGDNAELEPGDLKLIQDYVKQRNFDHSSIKQRFGNRFNTPGTPLRVTRTRFFDAIHHEIPPRLVLNNPKVGSFSKCEVCHRDAQQGSFDEDNVHIPR